jgi:hypothetical protein
MSAKNIKFYNARPIFFHTLNFNPQDDLIFIFIGTEREKVNDMDKI